MFHSDSASYGASGSSVPYSSARSASRLDTNGGRFYKIPGTNGAMLTVPSVTTVLGELSRPWTEAWVLKLMGEHILESVPTDTAISPMQLSAIVATGKARHKEVLRASGEWGTRVHDAMQTRLLTGKYPKEARGDAELLPCLRGFEEWWSSQRLSPVAVEETTWSLKHLFGGTFDLLAKDTQDRLFLCDWKTSKHTHASYSIQTTCYALAYEELTGRHVDELRVVRVSRSGEVEVVSVAPDERKELFQVFLALRAVWEWRRTYKCKPVTFCKKMF